MNDLTFEIEVDGKSIKYNIIKILAPEDSDIQYIVYTDGKEKYVSRYSFDNGKIKLNPVENETEWKYINTVMEGL